MEKRNCLLVADCSFFVAVNDEGSTEPPTTTAKSEVAEKAMEIANKVASEMGIPTWALVSIIIGKTSGVPQGSPLSYA